MFDSTAKSYLLAAEILWKRHKTEPLPLIAPISQCLALGVELFLKARLMERGSSADEVRTQYQHDIYRLWRAPEFDALRANAELVALQCAKVKPPPFADPAVLTVDRTIESLGQLYGRETDFALRYPTGSVVVPYPQPLLWVMAELLEHPRYMLP